jgi:ubiquinone/menaquinone biosynthesis C-methylase UbiE
MSAAQGNEMIVKHDSKSLSRQRYSQYAQGYVTSTTHATGADLDLLLEIAQPQADWIALDVATGGGHTALKFAPHVAQVIATDLTPEMLAAAKAFIIERGVENVAFKLADAEDLPFEAKTFHLVTCRIAPHHFANASRFVRESARVLKPGGSLLVQDHLLPDDERAACYVDAFERLRDPSHNRAFTESEWREMLQKAGLAVEHAVRIIKRHEFIPWAGRQGCTPDVVNRLVAMMAEAPAAAAEWMQPRDFYSAHATFVNHHIVIAGRKEKCG